METASARLLHDPALVRLSVHAERQWVAVSGIVALSDSSDGKSLVLGRVREVRGAVGGAVGGGYEDVDAARDDSNGKTGGCGGDRVEGRQLERSAKDGGRVAEFDWVLGSRSCDAEAGERGDGGKDLSVHFAWSVSSWVR